MTFKPNTGPHPDEDVAAVGSLGVLGLHTVSARVGEVQPLHAQVVELADRLQSAATGGQQVLTPLVECHCRKYGEGEVMW